MLHRAALSLLAVIVLAAPAYGQLPRPGDLAGEARRQSERAARDAAERAVAKTLFPLEEDAAKIRRQSPQIDGWQFGEARSMAALARTADGGFVLKPDYWTFEAQSYCLNAGTYERTGGAGYLSGLLTGKVSTGVAAVLDGAWRHQTVPQADIQMLVWGILSGTPVSQLNPRAVTAARTILTPQQFADLDGGALTFSPPVITQQARRRLPAGARAALDANERLRRVAARPSSSYADFEAVAILQGEPKKQKITVPSGRWSWHPDGYHIRYFSESYRRTTVEIVVGERYAVTRDARGRITEMRFADGSYVRTSYRDDVDSWRDRRLPRILAEAFDTVEIGSPDPATRVMRKATFEGGYAFRADRAARRAENLPQVVRIWAEPEDRETPLILAQGRGVDWGRTYERGREAHDRYEFYRDRYEGATRPATDADIDNIFDEEHYRSGVEAATTGDTGDRLGWITEMHERMARALARATDIIDSMGRDDPAPVSPVVLDPIYTPSRETGLPSGSGQRRGVSGRAF